MSSGCIVIGFSGVGENDCMLGVGKRLNCILIKNGNYPKLGKKLEKLLMTLKENPNVDETVKRNDIKTARCFQNSEAEAQSLNEFYDLCN